MSRANHPPSVPDKPTASREIGYCIYCGSTEQLSREHVIPRGIGGSGAIMGAHEAAVLRKASCEKCRVITHAFETQCQHQMFGHLRRRLGLSKSAGPAAVHGFLRFHDGSTKEIADHADKFPVGLLLPLFDKDPRLWLSADVKHQVVRAWISRTLFEPVDPAAFRGKASEVGVSITFDAEPYQRMLAKIGLGSAILRFGDDHFVPIVNDFIRGIEKDGIGKYIFGFDLEDELPPVSEKGHHQVITREEVREGERYVVSFVKLFANYGAPTNAVIVGIVKQNVPIGIEIR